MAFNSFISIILTHFLLLVTKTLAGKVPAIIVFGDSSVDSGNNNQIPTVLKGNFEPYGRDFYDKKATGRFCNGRIPPDFISEAFGLRPFVPAYLDPAFSISDFAEGVCFASAGTGYDNATSDVLNFVHQIYRMGARKISLTGVPRLPLERATNYGDGCNEKYNNVAKHFNVMLGGLVGRLNEELPGIRVVFAYAYNLLLQMITKPSSYGFEVAQDYLRWVICVIN